MRPSHFIKIFHPDLENSETYVAPAAFDEVWSRKGWQKSAPDSSPALPADEGAPTRKGKKPSPIFDSSESETTITNDPEED